MIFTSFGAKLTFALLFAGYCFALPPGYKGKPFKDQSHKSGPAVIPGTVQCALYDLGGEGVVYHDTTPINEGSKLNHTPNHCRPGVAPYTCYFRENEGVDISYTKDFADFNHPNLVDPPNDQIYVGWEDDGEWTNYTVKVKTAGTYKIAALYGKDANTLKFDVDGTSASVCKIPVATDNFHKWNKAEIGEITFPKTGLHVLTLHYGKGNNLATFEFVPVKK